MCMLSTTDVGDAEPRERDRSYADTDPEKTHTGILKLRGLPFAAVPEDIVQWFRSSAELSLDR